MSIITLLKQIAGAIDAAGPTFAVSAQAADLAAITGAGGAAKTLADLNTSVNTLAKPADLDALLKSGADTAIGVLKDIAGSGLPVRGADATGQDTYGLIVTAPARVCRRLHVTVGSNGAIVSLDGGTTDHLTLPANTTWLFEGLAIPADAAIHAKNLNAGSNYTALAISVW